MPRTPTKPDPKKKKKVKKAESPTAASAAAPLKKKLKKKVVEAPAPEQAAEPPKPKKRAKLAEDAAAEGAEATLVRRVAEEQCVDDAQARMVVRQACRPGRRMRVRGWVGGYRRWKGGQSGGQAGRWRVEQWTPHPSWAAWPGVRRGCSEGCCCCKGV